MATNEEERRRRWEEWHATRIAPTEARGWLQWAVTRFPCMYDAPQPSAFPTLDKWAQRFDAWGRVQSGTISALAGHILYAYNGTKRWKCGFGPHHRYTSLADAAKNMDEANRRGMAELILQAKGI